MRSQTTAIISFMTCLVALKYVGKNCLEEVKCSIFLSLTAKAIFLSYYFFMHFRCL